MSSLTVSDKNFFLCNVSLYITQKQCDAKYYNVIFKKCTYSDFTVVEIKHTTLYNY